MSRMEKKRLNKKKKRCLKISLIFISVFLILGLIFADAAIREMLAIQDQRVLGYERNMEIHYIYILGDKISIDQNEIIMFIDDIQLWTQNIINYVTDWITNKYGQILKRDDIF